MLLTSVPRAAGRAIAGLRAREFSRLDAGGHAYLDYTGSALYGISQIRAHHRVLEQQVLGNPHSAHGPSMASTETIRAARSRVLRFLGVDEATHAVCFTANASAAIKLVAESFPFGPAQACVLASDNHNSVGGIGAFARRAQAPVVWLPLEADLTLRDPDEALGRVGAGGGLVAFPAQSNFSGVLHSLSFVRQARGRGYSVLLDAAAFAGSHPLDLARCPADFVALSFYKLFGYPTGLGALVARREALERLTRPWFAGGTVDYVSVQTGRHQLRSGPEAFEDGTPDFLAVGALDSGFAMLEQVGMSAIEAHVARLAARLMGALLDLRHDNRQPVIRLYGPRDLRHRGGVVTFNVIDPDGVPVPYSTVEARARIAGVAVRGGCFCNPGASEAAFGFDAGRVGACLDTLGREFEPGRLADCLGRGTAVGAIRASLGLANNVRDVDRAIELIASFRSRGPAAHVRMSSAAPGA